MTCYDPIRHADRSRETSNRAAQIKLRRGWRKLDGCKMLHVYVNERAQRVSSTRQATSMVTPAETVRV